MNKDKAIQLLERLQDPEPYEPMLTSDAYDAIQMAIDALSADGDTISREAAIATAVTAAINWHKLANPQYSIAYCIGEAMRQLPPAQPERIKGRWVPADTLCGIKCSNCGYPVDDFCYSIDYIDLEYAPNFCPNCGADMRGEQE